ncbi:hypothetical protein NicSoilB8_46260 (plasmid) [Arthrobacter sp. NicSoilB8]|nr:hypothetical protein NicSoilB8_46260 [Arthrobacter sp. NicSoilB8]
MRRLDTAGHQAMLDTGHPFAATMPVLECLGITPRFLACSNGAITLQRDPGAPSGCPRERVESFDPTDMLRSIRTDFESARFAVEDNHGQYRHTEPFPDAPLAGPPGWTSELRALISPQRLNERDTNWASLGNG